MSGYDAEIKQWREQGYCVVSGMIEPDLLKKCMTLLHNKWDTVEKCCKDFGSNGELEFPCGEVIDHLTINENILDFVRKLLKDNDITLTQSDAWSKAGENPQFKDEQDLLKHAITYTYSKNPSIHDVKAQMSKEMWKSHGNIFSNQDQRIHMDYGNHTFLHPGDWHKPDTVAAIVYFHDTEHSAGGTAVVPRQGDDDVLYKQPFTNMPGYGNFKFINNKAAAEDYFRKNHPEVADFRERLYEREIIPRYKPGDILFYRLDTWHRGTPLQTGAIRTVMSLAWRRASCYWYNTWNPGYTKKNYYGVLEKLFSEMSPSQRSSLGVPPPGHPYWTQHTIAMVKCRYPGMDVQPYLDQLEVK